MAHVILKDLSGIPNSKQIDKYLYQIDKDVESKKQLEFEILDNAGNKGGRDKPDIILDKHVIQRIFDIIRCQFRFG